VSKKKTSYTPEFKAKVFREILTGEKTPLQISVEYGIHVKTVNAWAREGQEKLPGIFRGEVQEAEVALQKEIDLLHKKIGQLAVENDFLKKASGRLT
jgi:transposase